MRKVIGIPNEKEEAKGIVPVKLTYIQSKKGWVEVKCDSLAKRECEKIVHIGFCKEDGDMFAVYFSGYIMIFKGELNSGVY